MKNEKGLKIHQTKMGCLKGQSQILRTSQLGETEEEQDQDSNHSVMSLQVSTLEDEAAPEDHAADCRKKRVKWP